MQPFNFILYYCRGLPSKDPEEELKHKLEYEAMVEAAKKKGQFFYLILFSSVTRLYLMRDNMIRVVIFYSVTSLCLVHCTG